jgi:transcription antitermination factor NusG
MPLLALEPFIHPPGLLDGAVPPAGLDRWWVLHTRPRAEKTLARRFLDRSISFFLPLYQREWRSRGRKFRSFLPLFSGYVFLHGEPQARLVALETNLVAQVLPVDDQGQLHADLARVHHLITTGAPLAPEDRLESGDAVEIIKGPLAGLTGKVLRRGRNLKFVIEVQFLRRAVSAEVESWMIQPRGD